MQTALVDAVALFLQRSAQGQLEHARPLVRWLLRKARSQQAALRGAVLRRAGLFAEPQVRGAAVLQRRGYRSGCALLPVCQLPGAVAPSCRPLPQTSVLVCQVILALCHEGEHPIHTKDREVAVEGHEGQASLWRRG